MHIRQAKVKLSAFETRGDHIPAKKIQNRLLAALGMTTQRIWEVIGPDDWESFYWQLIASFQITSSPMFVHQNLKQALLVVDLLLHCVPVGFVFAL